MKYTLILSIAFVFIVSVPTANTAQAQTEPYIGQLMPVAFNFCPRGWLPTDGQLLAISGNESLFSLLGTFYGGDGRTTFGLPDLRGRSAISVGTGPGLSTYAQGQQGGAETVTLTQAEMPTHQHTLTELTNSQGTTDGLVIRSGGGEIPAETSFAGSGLAHENRPPYLAVQWCIATVGVFPSRN